MSRCAGSAAGGAVVNLTGTNFAAGASVTFGGAAASNVVVSSPTQMTVTVPSHAIGMVDVSVTQGTTATLANAFEYLPAPTTTYFSVDFENNTLGALTADPASGGAAVASTDLAFAGTHSGKSTSTATTGGSGSFVFTFGSGTPSNPALSDPNGVYLRWYIYVPATTVSLVQTTMPSTGQIKLHLFRQLAGSGQPGYIMCGFGADFPPGQVLTCFIDNGILTIAGGATNRLLADNWVEFQLWQRRANGTGQARGWVNGKPIFNVTNMAMGTDVASAMYRAYFGAAYVESPNGPVVVYVDNVAGANGYIDQ